MKKLLEPFGFTFGQLQDISTLLKHLETNGKTVSDFISYIEKEKIERINLDKKIKIQQTLSFKQWQKNALKCPDCSIVMSLFPVNSNPRDQVGNNFKSQWSCSSCGYEIFSTETIKEWLIKINKV